MDPKSLSLCGIHPELGAWGFTGGVSGRSISFDPAEVLCKGLPI